MTGFTNDICANRHGGNPESVAAFNKCDRQSQRENVYDAIRNAGAIGLTRDELAVVWTRPDYSPLSSVSARFTELFAAERIVKVGRRSTRAGCMAAVYVTPDWGSK